jgi:hypothetical protein
MRMSSSQLFSLLPFKVAFSSAQRAQIHQHVQSSSKKNGDKPITLYFDLVRLSNS